MEKLRISKIFKKNEPITAATVNTVIREAKVKIKDSHFANFHGSENTLVQITTSEKPRADIPDITILTVTDRTTLYEFNEEGTSAKTEMTDSSAARTAISEREGRELLKRMTPTETDIFINSNQSPQALRDKSYKKYRRYRYPPGIWEEI